MLLFRVVDNTIILYIIAYHECLSIRLNDAAPVKTVFAVDGCYMVPKRNKEVLIGATSIAGSFDTSVTARGMLSLLQRASHLLPVLNEGTIERTWAGVRPQAANQLPVMGPLHRRIGYMYWPLSEWHFAQPYYGYIELAVQRQKSVLPLLHQRSFPERMQIVCDF
ncbi:FAD-dependent oxidoreductase [Priestia aryabhattai]|uniref:FAD-dependent oxidoreductase n=1 Tax=Priestia aryabhattai TaxID=412384 RepID=UPI003138CCC3